MSLQLKVGQWVVVARIGIRRIKEIKSDGSLVCEDFDDELCISSKDLDKSIRLPASREKAEEIFSALRDSGESHLPPQNHARSNVYLEAIRSNDLAKAAKALWNLYRFPKPAQAEADKRADLEYFVYSELSHVLELDESQLRRTARDSAGVFQLPDRSALVATHRKLPKIDGYVGIGAFFVETELSVSDCGKGMLLPCVPGVWCAYADKSKRPTELLLVHSDKVQEALALVSDAEFIDGISFETPTITAAESTAFDDIDFAEIDKETAEGEDDIFTEIIEQHGVRLVLWEEGYGTVYATKKEDSAVLIQVKHEIDEEDENSDEYFDNGEESPEDGQDDGIYEELREEEVSILREDSSQWNAFVEAKRKDNPFYSPYICYADLSGLDLSRCDLSRANLTGSNLSGAKLVNTNLKDAFGADVIFDDAFFSHTDLRGAIFLGGGWNDTVIEDILFDSQTTLSLGLIELGAKSSLGPGLIDILTGNEKFYSDCVKVFDRLINKPSGQANDADSKAWLKWRKDALSANSHFQLRLSGECCLERETMEERDYTDADLSKALLVNIAADGSCFKGALLCEARMDGSSFRSCSFANADLRGASFRYCDLQGADFCGANLEGADFSGAFMNYRPSSEADKEENSWQDALLASGAISVLAQNEED